MKKVKMTDIYKWLIVCLTIVRCIFGVQNVYAAELEAEKPDIFFEANYQDDDYTYSYRKTEYFKLIPGGFKQGNAIGQKRFILNLKNADSIEFVVRAEYISAHLSACKIKNTFDVNPLNLTISIGNGKVMKSFNISQKLIVGSSASFTSKSILVTMEDLAKYSLGEEVVDISWYDEGYEKCEGCNKVLQKGFQIYDMFIYDYRGICSNISSVSNTEKGIVTINAAVDKYVKRCEWKIKFENTEEYITLCDGLLENGMIIMGANTSNLTIQNMPGDKGKVMSVELFTYDENGQKLTELPDGYCPYTEDINISSSFKIGLDDMVVISGQAVSFDLSTKIPSDTRSIKWQSSRDGNVFSYDFDKTVFLNKINSFNNANLRINNTTVAMNRYYFRCVCFDEYGRECVSDSVRLYVISPVIYYNNIPISKMYVNGKKVF